MTEFPEEKRPSAFNIEAYGHLGLLEQKSLLLRRETGFLCKIFLL